MTLYYDKLIDRYIPTDSGWNFHPDNTALLPSTEIDGKLVIEATNPLPTDYKQLMYSNVSSGGNATVYYLDMITSKDSGTLPKIMKDPAASNAKAIELAPETTMIFRTNYPYNKDRLKKVLCRCRKEAGAPTLHVGVIGIEDKAYKQPDGTYGNNDFYEVTVSGDVTESYVTYVGYIVGTDTVENIELVSRPNRDPDYPAKLLDGTTDIALMIRTGSGTGSIYIDSIELQDTENALTELPKGTMVVNSLEGLTDDNKLSPVEKAYVKTLLAEIDSEYDSVLADGTAAGVDCTLLTTKYNALRDIVVPLLENMKKASDIDSTFDLAFDEYYAIKTSVQSEVARLTMRSITLATNSNVVMYSREKGYSPDIVILRAHTFNVPANEITWSAMIGGTSLTLSPVLAEGSTSENPIYKEYFRSFTTNNLPFNDVLITATVANSTLEATVSVSIMESPFDPPLYFGVSATPPNTEGKKIGDHYLDTENIPWRFNGSTWVEVLSGDNAPGNYSEIMANVLADALNSENTIPSTSVIYGYFESIVAHRLLVTDDAKSFQFNVSPDGYTYDGVDYPIFEITVPNPNNPSERKQLLSIDGYKKELQVETNGTFNGEIVSNAITSTIGTPPANKAHTVTTKNIWYSTDIYNGVGGISVNSGLTSISGGFRSKSIVKAGKLTSSTSTLLVETYSNSNSEQGSGFEHYATKTVPAGSTQVYFNISVSNDTWPGGGDVRIVIYRGSTSIAAFTSRGASNQGPYSVQYGDVVQYYSEGYLAWGTTNVSVTSNFRAAPKAQGLYLVYSDNSSEILRTGRWYDIPFTLGGYSSTYNLITGQLLTTEIIKDIKSDTWNLCGSGSTCKIQTLEQSSASTYNVIEVKATSSFIDFNTTSGHKIIYIWNSSPTSSVGVYKSLSYSLNIANTPNKVTVASVYPKDSNATIGSSANPFSAGAFKSLSTDSANVTNTLTAGSISTSGIDTGNGSFKIGQNLRTTDSPTFAKLKLTTSTYGSQEIAGNGIWLVPIGIYTMTGFDSNSLYIQVYDGSRWMGGADGFGGAVISDGSNVRIRNYSSRVEAIRYRKFT